MRKHPAVFVVHFIIVGLSFVAFARPVSAQSILSVLPEGSGGRIVDSLLLTPRENDLEVDPLPRVSAFGALYSPLIISLAVGEKSRARVISQYASSVSLATIALSDGNTFGYLTTSAVTGAAFATYAFRRYAPESSYRLPVTVAAYSLAAVTLASDANPDRSFESLALDVFAGLVSGYALPALHERLGLENVSFVFLPGTLVVTLRI